MEVEIRNEPDNGYAITAFEPGNCVRLIGDIDKSPYYICTRNSRILHLFTGTIKIPQGNERFDRVKARIVVE